MSDEQLSFIDIGPPQPINEKRKRHVVDKAHAAAPGSGPAGKFCRTCAHREIHEGACRNFQKCGLVKHTRGAATDIRAKDPACYRYEEEKP